MTSKELKNLVVQAKSIDAAQWRLHTVNKRLQEELRLKKEGITDELTETAIRELAAQRESAQAEFRAAQIAHTKLWQILGSIKEAQIYQILSSRYLQGRSWRNVAMGLGGGNTEESVRKIAVRYLAKLP